MKILMTVDTIGGVWTYALELIRALDLYQCDVALATMGRALSASQMHEAAQLPNLTLYESQYKLEWMEAPWEDVDQAGAWLLEIARETQPDIVHLNNYAHGVLPWSAPVLMMGHSCVLSWWEAVKRERAPEEWRTYHQRVKAGLRRAALVAAPTYAMLSALQYHYGPLHRTAVIYNGRTPELFSPTTKEPFIFSMGRLWDEAKNVQALEAIAPQLGWPVYVAGQDAPPSGGAYRLQRVRWLGHLAAPDIASVLTRASIYVLPARYEPFGLSVLEAGFAGCALVLGDIASLREVWGAAACFVPPMNLTALAEILQELITKPAQRQAFAKAARQQAQNYHASTMGAAYWRAYCRLRSSRSLRLERCEDARYDGSDGPKPLFEPSLSFLAAHQS
jgi:glycosyltransferase involved in cell wall biosynthesis